MGIDLGIDATFVAIYSGKTYLTKSTDHGKRGTMGLKIRKLLTNGTRHYIVPNFVTVGEVISEKLGVSEQDVGNH